MRNGCGIRRSSGTDVTGISSRGLPDQSTLALGELHHLGPFLGLVGDEFGERRRA